MDEDAISELCINTCRLEVLFDEIQEKVKIPQSAIIGITQITDRIYMHLKRRAGLQKNEGGFFGRLTYTIILF